MKKDKTVIAAELAVKAKREEIEEVQKTVAMLESELRGLVKSVRYAQEQIDRALPLCKLVTKAWRSGNVKSVEEVAILRQTKTGRLVVKRIGDTFDGCELSFKFSSHSGRFVPVEKSEFASNVRTLEDVPDQLMPKA